MGRIVSFKMFENAHGEAQCFNQEHFELFTKFIDDWCKKIRESKSAPPSVAWAFYAAPEQSRKLWWDIYLKGGNSFSVFEVDPSDPLYKYELRNVPGDKVLIGVLHKDGKALRAHDSYSNSHFPHEKAQQLLDDRGVLPHPPSEINI